MKPMSFFAVRWCMRDATSKSRSDLDDSPESTRRVSECVGGVDKAYELFCIQAARLGISSRAACIKLRLDDMQSLRFDDIQFLRNW